MKLIRILVGKENQEGLSNLKTIIHRSLSIVTEKGLQFDLKENFENGSCQLLCQFWPLGERTLEKLDAIRAVISETVAQYIVEYKEEEIFLEILAMEFGYTDSSEQKQIMDFIFSILDDNEPESKSIRKLSMLKKMEAKISSYLWNENTIYIDGFIRFRLKEQWDEWRQIVEHGIEEYLMDKEYKRFIRLARYIISAQEPKMELLHILHIDDRNLLLFDDHWMSLNEEDTRQHATTERHPKGYEDHLIQTLIALAPKKIVVHTDQQNHHIIYTIKRIFEEQVHICIDCLECNVRLRQCLN